MVVVDKEWPVVIVVVNIAWPSHPSLFLKNSAHSMWTTPITHHGLWVYVMQCNCEPQTEDLGKGRRGVFFNNDALCQSWFLKEESLWLQILKINALSYPSLSLRIKHSQRKLNFNHHSLANRRIEDQAKARSGKKNEFGNSGRTEGGYVCMYVFLHRLFNLRGQRNARVVASFEDADRQKLRLGGLGLQQQVCQQQPSRPGSHNHRPSCTRLRHLLACFGSSKTNSS